MSGGPGLLTRGRRLTGFKSGDNEVWLTPKAWIDVLGPFDLDPCACPEPRPWATAERMIAPPDDGLEAKWEGRVYVNPPFGRADEFMRRLARHGDGVALVAARTETDWWFESVWSRATGILFVRGRVRFDHAVGGPSRWDFPGPIALVAYGEDNARRLLGAGIRGAWTRGPW